MAEKCPVEWMESTIERLLDLDPALDRSDGARGVTLECEDEPGGRVSASDRQAEAGRLGDAHRFLCPLDRLPEVALPAQAPGQHVSRPHDRSLVVAGYPVPWGGSLQRRDVRSEKLNRPWQPPHLVIR